MSWQVIPQLEEQEAQFHQPASMALPISILSEWDDNFEREGRILSSLHLGPGLNLSQNSGAMSNTVPALHVSPLKLCQLPW